MSSKYVEVYCEAREESQSGSKPEATEEKASVAGA
jgi:hypothetical protein